MSEGVFDRAINRHGLLTHGPDDELAALDGPVAVMLSDPVSRFYARHTLDRLVELLPRAVRMAPVSPSPETRVRRRARRD